jgi:ribosomal protein L34E
MSRVRMTNLIEKIRMLTRVKQTHIKIIEGSKITVRDKIFINVFRKNTVRGDTDYHYDTFKIPVRRWTTVLDALLYAKDHLDVSIAIRYSCRMASCGSCGMKINGIPRLMQEFFDSIPQDQWKINDPAFIKQSEEFAITRFKDWIIEQIT